MIKISIIVILVCILISSLIALTYFGIKLKDKLFPPPPSTLDQTSLNQTAIASQ